MPENLGTKLGSAFIEVSANLVGFGAGLSSDITNSLLSQQFVVAQALEGFGKAVFSKFSLPLIAATTANIAQFQALDREIRTTLTLFGTAPRLVDDTFSTMAAGIREVSEEVGGLERDIADGLYQAISAGIPRGGVFDFLEVAQMAAMSDRTADITTAVDGLTTVINAFGLEATQAEEAADVMFATVRLGKTTFGELASDIGRVAPLAANAGVSFNELFASVGALTLGGLQTSESISFLRAAITGLLRPTDELNTVFKAAGFNSAEAAIPVIGLQQAFQLVVDAVGGSTSKLQELIGTSEGVSAILGVTGDNADKFARGLNAAENATGAISTAFEIMDGAVGRTFGRMTETFDRLGNTFGEMAAQFAVPVFDLLTEVITRLVGVVENFRPIVEGLGIAFGTVVSAFNIPVFTEVVALIAAMAIGISGIIGGLGLWALTFGRVINAGLKVQVVIFLVNKLKGSFLAAQAASTRLGTSMVKMTDEAAKAGGSIGFLGKAARGTGRSFQLFGKSLLVSLGIVAAIGVAIGLTVIAIGKYIKSQREAAEAADVFGKGVDQLAESLGVSRRRFADWESSIEDGVVGVSAFEDANRDLVNRLREVNDEFGNLIAADLAEAFIVSLEFENQGEFDAAVLAIERLVDIDLDLDFGSLESASVVTQRLAEGVTAAFDAFKNTEGIKDAGRQAETLGLAVVTLLKAARESGDVELFDSLLADMGAQLDAVDTAKLGQLASGIRSAIEASEEAGGLDVDITSGPGIFGKVNALLTREGDLTRRLIEQGFTFDFDPVAISFEKPDREPIIDFGLTDQERADAQARGDLALAQLERIRNLRDEFGITLSQAANTTDEQFSAARDSIAGMGQAFDDARASVEEAFGAIEAGLFAQNPLLDVYSGAIKQSFAEWKTGQAQFRADVEAVTTLRDTLVDSNLPQALIDAFDRQPIEKQAWLAALGESDLEEALAEMSETFNLLDENAKLRQLQSFTDIMDAGGLIITEGFAEYGPIAADAGLVVADLFDEQFDIGAANWIVTAEGWMSQLQGVLSGTLTGPSVGPISFDGAGGVHGGNVTYNTTINNPTTDNLGRDLERANAVNATNAFAE